jgi:hypothetical protein
MKIFECELRDLKQKWQTLNTVVNKIGRMDIIHLS